MKTKITTLIISLCFVTSIYAENINDAQLLKSIKSVFHEIISQNEITKLLSKSVWNKDKTAVVVVKIGESSTFIYVFLKQKNGSYLGVDISFLEKINFNTKLGRDRSYYDRFEITPFIWENIKLYKLGVSIRTQAWKDGQRYTVDSKEVCIKENGEAIWPH